MTTAISEGIRARRSEIVRQHIDAENRHDPEGVVATFDQPNYDIPSFGDAGQVNGPQAVLELWQGLVAGFPDLHIEPGRHLHSDDAVFVEVVFSGTQQGEWAGIPATGRRASVRIACLYEFEEDKLVHERVWFDFATIMRQLGVLAS
jgi:steroid delta-isomerase-like uncharacterized protein